MFVLRFIVVRPATTAEHRKKNETESENEEKRINRKIRIVANLVPNKTTNDRTRMKNKKEIKFFFNFIFYRCQSRPLVVHMCTIFLRSFLLFFFFFCRHEIYNTLTSVCSCWCYCRESIGRMQTTDIAKVIVVNINRNVRSRATVAQPRHSIVFAITMVWRGARGTSDRPRARLLFIFYQNMANTQTYAHALGEQYERKHPCNSS